MLQTEIVLHADNIKRIEKNLKENINDKEAKIICDENAAKCVFEKNSDNLEAVSKSVREFIVENIEPAEIERLIEKGYGFFEKSEKAEFKKDIEKAIKAQPDILTRLFVLRRNRIIENRAEDFLKESPVINIDGFLTFRLKDYSEEIENLIDYHADDFMMKREYKEFLSLLSAYVDTQERKTEKLNIVVTENREYLYYDAHGKLLNGEYEAEAAIEFGGDYSSEDLLINVLINKNPGSIVIHNRQFIKKEISSTIEAIFGDRIRFCDGCGLCGVLM